MKNTFKLATVSLISAAVLTVTGCNTVTGAFQGAGQDTKAVATAVGIHTPHHYSTHQGSVYHKSVQQRTVHHKTVHHKATSTGTSTTSAPASTSTDTGN